MEHKKSLHRLLGGVFLLAISLLVLLNVTARTKPVAANKKTIDIHITETDQNQIIESTPTAQNINNIQQKQTLHVTNIAKNTIQQTSNKLDTAEESKLQQPLTTSTNKLTNTSSNPLPKPENQKENLPQVTPQIITQTRTTQHKPTPLEILNGTSNTSSQTTTKTYFIQIVSSTNKSEVIALRKHLIKHGVHTNIESNKHDGRTFYRLRTGPFNSEHQAKQHLHQVIQQLGS